ncbi:hypothetical protein ACQP0C_33845 [Nocardia sp. CA-129566]|uniref:hypothetical protein n=1 Tax=Nocardia sp. CA-129566 TaxID=3239976 RepID=UPI003D95B4C5
MKRQFLVAVATATLITGCVSSLGGTASAAPARSPEGTVSVTLRGTHGSYDVACSDINTEFKVSPSSGTIDWAATAHDIDISFAAQDLRRGLLPAVVVTPAAGLLGPGQSTVVRVRGSVAAPAKKFWIWVIAPNSTGRGGVGVEFTCRAR